MGLGDDWTIHTKSHRGAWQVPGRSTVETKPHPGKGLRASVSVIIQCEHRRGTERAMRAQLLPWAQCTKANAYGNKQYY